MKVIYKNTVSEKIQEEAHNARKLGREIERIELTKKEYKELHREQEGRDVFLIPKPRDYVEFLGIICEYFDLLEPECLRVNKGGLK